MVWRSSLFRCVAMRRSRDEFAARRIHLTSRTKRFFLSDTVVDTPELEELRALIESELAAWGGQAIRTTQMLQ